MLKLEVKRLVKPTRIKKNQECLIIHVLEHLHCNFVDDIKLLK